MAPYLFEIGGFQVGTYGLMMAFGFLFSGWLLSRELGRLGSEPEYAWEFVLVTAVCGVVGARGLAIIETAGETGGTVWQQIFSRGGLTWQGGFALATVGSLLFLRWRKLSLVRMADVNAPMLFLGYAFGRGGCQLSGDGCYGIHTDLPWGMDYAAGVVKPEELGITAPVHPTPLYEIIYSLAGFLLFWFWLRKKPLPAGARIALYLVVSSIGRFLVEFIRLNVAYGGLSLAQWLSVGTFVAGGLWLFFLRGRPPDDPSPVRYGARASTTTT